MAKDNRIKKDYFSDNKSIDLYIEKELKNGALAKMFNTSKNTIIEHIDIDCLEDNKTSSHKNKKMKSK